ncbi:MAG: hypothetical protein GY852_11245, partial [bacterium]|nr:hypothetical protein [bacterium]
MKVIPIIHPAAVLRTAKWEKRCVLDWGKVKREGESSAITTKPRRHFVDPSETQVEEFVREVEALGEKVAMAVDIETWGKQLSCVGFSIRPDESITIPLIGKNKNTMFNSIKRLCESESQKILCNGLYDWYWLAWEGIWIKNFLWDVQLMHHALDPADNHSLDYLASIYCEGYQYWKDEAKDAEEIVKYAYDLEALWVYNGLDCCYTRELVDILYKELSDENMVEFYFKHYQK